MAHASFKRPERYEIVEYSKMIGRQRAAISERVENCKYPVIDGCLAEYRKLLHDIPTPEQMEEKVSIRLSLKKAKALMPGGMYRDMMEIVGNVLGEDSSHSEVDHD